ncbi:MAG: glycosyltransferase [Acidimicrobiia bacterium]
MNADVAPRATIVVVPRDSFALTQRCLERLLACTPAPRRVVVVDGGSPPPVASWLADAAVEHDLTLVRSDHLLTPNEARNLALPHATTEFVVIADNDAYVEPGWLERLLECADEHGADAVVPLHCIGEPGRERVHVAGGTCSVQAPDGHARLEEHHPFGNEPLTAVAGDTQRRECTLFEFHLVLLRRAALAEVEPLDEGLRSLLEHTDLSLQLQERGRHIWYDPTVSVTYIPAKPLRGADRSYFVTRWSDDWNERSAARFCERWGLPADDPRVRHTVEFGAWLRSRAHLPYRSPMRVLRHHRRRVPRSIVDRVAQRRALSRYRRDRAAAAPPRLTHRASWMPRTEVP